MGNRVLPTKKIPITGKVHESDKEKLKKSGYNVRQAVEYFNKVVLNEYDKLDIDEFFINKELEDAKDEVIRLERKLESIQVKKDKLYRDKLSDFRVNSYCKVLSIFNEDTTNQSLDHFLEGSYVKDIIRKEVIDTDCTVDDYIGGLKEYYEKVILVSNTI